MDYQERRQRKGETTRLAILDAATRLARQMSFDRMTIRDVCQAAGVTTGAFYHHFTSKEDLLTQGFASLDSFIEESLRTHRDLPPLERLETLLRLYAQFVEDLGWQTMSLYYSRRLSNPQSASISPQRYTLQAMAECLTDLAQIGLSLPNADSRWAADFFFRHFRGVVIDWALHRGGYDLWDKLEQDYQLFAIAFQARA